MTDLEKIEKVNRDVKDFLAKNPGTFIIQEELYLDHRGITKLVTIGFSDGTESRFFGEIQNN
jgi:hypothetical protein